MADKFSDIILARYHQVTGRFYEFLPMKIIFKEMRQYSNIFVKVGESMIDLNQSIDDDEVREIIKNPSSNIEIDPIVKQMVSLKNLQDAIHRESMIFRLNIWKNIKPL